MPTSRIAAKSKPTSPARLDEEAHLGVREHPEHVPEILLHQIEISLKHHIHNFPRGRRVFCSLDYCRVIVFTNGYGTAGFWFHVAILQ